MCGLVGILRLEGAIGGDLPLARSMVERMAHRGPDNTGVLQVGPCALAHVRLAILDLNPEANQPFVDERTGVTLVYNGEVFNFVELRTELEGLGHRFRTRSDTEVVLRSYLQWGADAPKRWNGMWALALFDPRVGELFLSRDRFGAKPLYWAQDRGRFLFASEIKAILHAAPGFSEPNWALLSGMARRSAGVTGRSTFFQRIEALEPAHNLVVTLQGRHRFTRHWDYPAPVPPVANEREAVERFAELFIDAVRLRMRSDVPVGVTLSGGIDSGVILSVVRRTLAAPTTAYTAIFPGAGIDESQRAEALASGLGVPWSPIRSPEGKAVQQLARAVWHMDAPTHCPAVIPLLHVMDHIRAAGTIVVLEGQGSDELLGGYEETTLPALIGDAWDSSGPSGAIGALRGYSQGWGGVHGLLWVVRAAAPGLGVAWRRLRGDESVYRGPLGQEGMAEEPTRPPGDRMRALLINQHRTMLRALLHYGDAISMAASVENRMPFLDHRLVDFAFALPTSWTSPPGRGKQILKRAMVGTAPPTVLEVRRKLGFETPYARWLRAACSWAVRPILLDPKTLQRGIFERKPLEQAITAFEAGDDALASPIFRWLAIELWLRGTVDQPGAAAPLVITPS